ncbi:hypothetical protein [Planctomicrobium piriforme]|uniref:Uncharacterized protein n=1 Tax=Planctomicrobium piriforme TaxID=1576369 RepID=A0A1I3EBC7_9PLAN|nr:hypothetical protein [Planctomicrobium piriforme]SFH96208.1 hypothetical protein SAMN05421753_104149 [Planctomicrobium piriforme]
MKLWHLQRREYPETWDISLGYVVRAESEVLARQMAATKQDVPTEQNLHGDPLGEDRDDDWLDPAVTSCEELAVEGPQQIVMSNFKKG